MKKFLNTDIGRLRLLAFLEGVSFILLVFIAMPVKYYYLNPILVKTIGPVHGVLFLAFVFYTFTVASDREWQFKTITWKLLVASILPFGTFYVDSKILSKLELSTNQVSSNSN